MKKLICFFRGHDWEMGWIHGLYWKFTCKRCGKETTDMGDTF